MNPIYEKLQGCLKSVREKTDFVPKVAIVLGSGLGDYANDTGLPVDYESIKVKYKDTFLEVGEFHGQGTLDYAKILHEENSDEVIDYEELVKYYSRIRANICPPPTFKECSKKLKNIPNKEDI